MSVVAQVAAVVAALVHLVVWVCEAFLIGRVHQSMFGQPARDVPAIRLWAFGAGFYNLFLACGLIAGLIAVHGGQRRAGRGRSAGTEPPAQPGVGRRCGGRDSAAGSVAVRLGGWGHNP